MANFAPTLEWIDSQAGRMRGMVEEFAGINSNTRNLEGLGRLTDSLKPYLVKLDSNVELVPLGEERIIDSLGRDVSYPLAPAIRVRKRTSAPLQVFLNIHIDTVYPKDDPFQKVEQVGADTLRGPGVIDAKGGLVVLMTALEAVERSGLAQNMGWEVFLNTDEEIGSPGSSGYFAEAARRHHLALLFEPSMPDGAFVAERKG